MNCMSEEFQQKFQQLLQLKDIYSNREVLPQRMQRLKLFDIKFQLKQIRHQQQKRLDQIINSSIKSQCTQQQLKAEKTVSKQYSSLFIADQQNICLSCDKYIFEKKVELHCHNKFHHSYHSSCLATIMKHQLQQQCIQFQCLCKSQIKNGQILKQRALDLEVYVNKLMENQLYYMKYHLPNMKQCANKDCDFFWVCKIPEKKRSQPHSNSHSPLKTCRLTYVNYCPNCRFQ
ncbi:unnamed protein product [Paramecium primaurelia]|uniref:Uncharacterized protein n=1 Tax=Paramecium primaurelia TaxID=5886 RepID=A0A8S1KFT2_PARPR|nr:unnamed protein product [Paramecium primaurelia]